MLWLGFGFIILFLSACSSPLDSSTRGMSGDSEITARNIPDEPPKEQIISSIKESPSEQINVIIAANFPKVDEVTDGQTTAEIYATTQFHRDELSEQLTEKVEPKEISDEVDDTQMFIYPDYFITLKSSEADSSVLLIEVASEAFVERNYSPSFLSTYFTIRMLDSLFGNNWSSRRADACLTGDCYGGYSGKKRGSVMGTPNRGQSSYRGGGPGTGK